MPDSTNTDGKVKLTDAELRCCHMAQCDRDDAEGIEAWRAEFRQIARDEPGAHCMDCRPFHPHRRCAAMSRAKAFAVLALLLLTGCDEFKSEMTATEQRAAIEACHRAGFTAYANFGSGLSFTHAKVVSYSCRPRDKNGDPS